MPKQDEKDLFLATFCEFLAERSEHVNGRDGHEMITCGDWNIAHREADLKNHKGNHKCCGFLPHEREWMTDVFADGSGWTDIVRYRRPDEIGPYSWWSQRCKAFDNDAGWRIDYHVVTDGLVERAVGSLGPGERVRHAVVRPRAGHRRLRVGPRRVATTTRAASEIRPAVADASRATGP